MIRPAFFAALILILFSGCDSSTLPAPYTDHRLPDDLQSDVFELNGARMDGSILHLNVSYGGGCAMHTFTAYNTGQIMKSNPPGLVLYVAHDGGGDLCEAYLTEDVQIDLTWLIAEMGGSFWMNVAVFGSEAETIRIEYDA
jgi:hypothetical protein